MIGVLLNVPVVILRALIHVVVAITWLALRLVLLGLLVFGGGFLAIRYWGAA